MEGRRNSSSRWRTVRRPHHKSRLTALILVISDSHGLGHSIIKVREGIARLDGARLTASLHQSQFADAMVQAIFRTGRCKLSWLNGTCLRERHASKRPCLLSIMHNTPRADREYPTLQFGPISWNMFALRTLMLVGQSNCP